tara:strand:- start:6532 stop:6819 length:288 start_codon:yes stop_codon:yes gene_type:complete
LFIIPAGFPPRAILSSKLLVTTDPKATTTLPPNVTPGFIACLAPQQLSPGFIVACLAPQQLSPGFIVACLATQQLSPILVALSNSIALLRSMDIG